LIQSALWPAVGDPLSTTLLVASPLALGNPFYRPT